MLIGLIGLLLRPAVIENIFFFPFNDPIKSCFRTNEFLFIRKKKKCKNIPKNTSWDSYYTAIMFCKKKKELSADIFSLSYLLLIIIYIYIYRFILFYPMILHAKRKIKNHANYSTTFIPAYI